MYIFIDPVYCDKKKMLFLGKGIIRRFNVATSYSWSQIICYIIVVLKVLKFRNSITSYPPAVAILLHYYPFPLILARRHWNHALRLINNIPIRILQFNSSCPSITLQFTTKVFNFWLKPPRYCWNRKWVHDACFNVKIQLSYHISYQNSNIGG